MLVIRLITIFAFALLVAEPLYVLIGYLRKRGDREKKITFLRNFKMGKCVIVYITAVPLYFIGHLYSGMNILDSFFVAVSKIIGLVVLGYDTSSVAELMGDYPFYSLTIYFCYFLVFVNALMFTVSITHQYIASAFNAMRPFVGGERKLFIFGNNPRSLMIYSSEGSKRKLVIDELDRDAKEKLYLEGVAYRAVNDSNAYIDLLIRAAIKKASEHVIVINTENDEKNIAICRAIAERIAACPEAQRDRLYHRVKVFVFGDRSYEAIYEDIVRDGFGCIHYVNKHRAIATDFVDKYPLTAFMDERHIDYKTSLIRQGVNINVLMIGFGKTNQQILMTSIANNQFIEAGSPDPKIKPVNYYLIDREDKKSDKSLNHNYYRFELEMKNAREEAYLPMPEKPAGVESIVCDVNDKAFYDNLRRIALGGALDVNAVVIAYGSDLENMDMAKKLLEKKREWGASNMTVFVKVGGLCKNETVLDEDGCFFIGNEAQTVYNIERIVDDKLYNMAKMRNEAYDLEYSIRHDRSFRLTEKSIGENAEASRRGWYMKKSEMERESSLYCCLSLRSKLHLMGLDYCRSDDRRYSALGELSNEKYLEIYAPDDKPITGNYGVSALGKDIVSYTLDFKRTRRRNMAIHEHLRWNSFMISKGMVPADKRTILNERVPNKNGELKYTNGKNYALRRHGNLTTFEGLVEFRKMIARREGGPEEEFDVIMYDYQLLDDAHWLLSRNGYKIVKKAELDAARKNGKNAAQPIRIATPLGK